MRSTRPTNCRLGLLPCGVAHVLVIPIAITSRCVQLCGRDRGKRATTYDQYAPGQTTTTWQQRSRVSNAPDLHAASNTERTSRWVIEFCGRAVRAASCDQGSAIRKQG